MREPSKLCAILDDAAAVGAASRLALLSIRWRARGLERRDRTDDVIARLWANAASAAELRAYAINLRKGGNIGDAVRAERLSESHLGCMARMAKRTP